MAENRYIIVINVAYELGGTYDRSLHRVAPELRNAGLTLIGERTHLGGGCGPANIPAFRGCVAAT